MLRIGLVHYNTTDEVDRRWRRGALALIERAPHDPRGAAPGSGMFGVIDTMTTFVAPGPSARSSSSQHSSSPRVAAPPAHQRPPGAGRRARPWARRARGRATPRQTAASWCRRIAADVRHRRPYGWDPRRRLLPTASASTASSPTRAWLSPSRALEGHHDLRRRPATTKFIIIGDEVWTPMGRMARTRRSRRSSGTQCS